MCCDSLVPLHGSLLVHGEGGCVIQQGYELRHIGPPKMDWSLWRTLTKCDPLEQEMAIHSCQENPANVSTKRLKEKCRT